MDTTHCLLGRLAARQTSPVNLHNNSLFCCWSCSVLLFLNNFSIELKEKQAKMQAEVDKLWPFEGDGMCWTREKLSKVIIGPRKKKLLTGLATTNRRKLLEQVGNFLAKRKWMTRRWRRWKKKRIINCLPFIVLRLAEDSCWLLDDGRMRRQNATRESEIW